MIKVDMEKAKNIAHTKRRTARTEEFKPLDIEVTIPMFSEQAEQKRQEVRERYAEAQIEIDQAANPDELTTVLKKFS